MPEKSQIFWTAAIWQPTPQQAKEGKKALVLVPPTFTLATSEAVARVKAAQTIPTTLSGEDHAAVDLDQVEVLCRPF